MKHFKKSAYIVAGQLFFFSLFVWYFIHNSFLRPNCGTAIECGLALVLVVAMAINYWLFYPFVFRKHSFWLYTVVMLAVSALATLLEYKLTIGTLLHYIPADVIVKKKLSIRLLFFLNCFLRNICLMGFAGLMADNLGQKFRLLETDNLLLRRKKQVLVQRNGKDDLIIDASTICYVQQRQNYTQIFTIEGEKFERRGSLSFFEEASRGLNGVKISKSIIVFMPYVQALNDKEVTVITMESPQKVENLPLGRSIAPSAILEIERYLHQKVNSEEAKTIIDSKDVDVQTSSVAVGEEIKSENTLTEQQEPMQPVRRKRDNKKSSMIRKYVSHHPNCNIKDIVSATKIPKSTATRYLKELQAKNLIEYVGSKKTGGYRVVEKKDDSPKP